MGGFVVAGIGTEIGKTIASAVLVEALDADYWKPIQAGDLDRSDSQRIADLAPGHNRRIHPETYKLSVAMSPHAAAAIDDLTIDATRLRLPKTSNTLIVEIAGGLMVPLGPKTFNIDLLQLWQLPVVLVSQYYLGSINHTLLSTELLQQRNIEVAGLILNGEPVESSRSAIISASKLPVLLEIPHVNKVAPGSVATWARELRL